MPHVILSGSILLSNTFEHMEKILFKDQKSHVIIRINEYFINQPGDIILAKTVAVDQKLQSFYIMVMKKEDKTTIRLDPMTDPEKTDGGKDRSSINGEKDPGDRKNTQPFYFKDKHPGIHRQAARE